MKTRRTKLLYILALLVVLLLLVFTVNLVLKKTTNVCLDADDYRDLTGKSTLITNPKTSFYARIFEFSGTSIGSLDEQEVVTSLTSFYKTHRDKSILINVSGANQSTTNEQIGAARIQTFVDQLKNGGIKQSAIQTSAPQFLQLDADYDGIVTVSVITRQDCQP